MTQAAPPRASDRCQPTWAVKVGVPEKGGDKRQIPTRRLLGSFKKKKFFFGRNYRENQGIALQKSYREVSLPAEKLVDDASA